jgi:ABC-type dipeptide/oligopeptide/nickel transport system permease component
VARFFWFRLAWALPIILVILVVSFFLTRLVPGDPILALVGDYPAPPEYIAEMRQIFGLDQPLPVQLGLYILNLFRGDLGFSFANQQPVLALVLERAMRTLYLMIPALILSSLLAVALGLFAARRPGGIIDSLITWLVLIVDSIPVFWMSQIFIIVVAVDLRLLPAQGMLSIRGYSGPLIFDFLLHWILPGLVVTLAYLTVVARVARASLFEMVNQDFVTTALAKGMTNGEVLRKHVLPNALIPVISVIGYNFGHAVTGAIMVEAVFAWPGLGGLFVSSIASRDYPVLQAIFLLTSITVVVTNLATDLLYGVIDPRVRYGRLGK